MMEIIILVIVVVAIIFLGVMYTERSVEKFQDQTYKTDFKHRKTWQ